MEVRDDLNLRISSWTLEIKTSVEQALWRCKDKRSFTGPIFVVGSEKWSYTRGESVKTKSANKRVIEQEGDSWKEIQGLCLPYLFPHDIIFYSSNSHGRLNFHTLFRSPGNFWKIIVANKLLHEWTKTEFHVFVNFFNCEAATGFNYYLRHSDTAINTFEHVVVQPYISWVMVQRPIWHRNITMSI